MLVDVVCQSDVDSRFILANRIGTKGIANSNIAGSRSRSVEVSEVVRMKEIALSAKFCNRHDLRERHKRSSQIKASKLVGLVPVPSLVGRTTTTTTTEVLVLAHGRRAGRRHVSVGVTLDEARPVPVVGTGRHRESDRNGVEERQMG